MQDEPLEEDSHVTKKEFNTFLFNHFAHLTRDVATIKGTLVVLIPLVMAILGLVLYAVTSGD